MQNFTSTGDLLQAFKKISIHPDFKNRSKTADEKSENKSKDSKQLAKEDIRQKESRCYNCNLPGHIANGCKRPCRERGSCYGCGEFGHLSKDCPKKIKPTETREIGNVEINSEDHGFRRDVNYEVSNTNIKYVMQILYSTPEVRLASLESNLLNNLILMALVNYRTTFAVLTGLNS